VRVTMGSGQASWLRAQCKTGVCADGSVGWVVKRVTSEDARGVPAVSLKPGRGWQDEAEEAQRVEGLAVASSFGCGEAWAGEDG
jgi:hypothetical protein